MLFEVQDNKSWIVKKALAKCKSGIVQIKLTPLVSIFKSLAQLDAGRQSGGGYRKLVQRFMSKLHLSDASQCTTMVWACDKLNLDVYDELVLIARHFLALEAGTTFYPVML